MLSARFLVAIGTQVGHADSAAIGTMRARFPSLRFLDLASLHTQRDTILWQQAGCHDEPAQLGRDDDGGPQATRGAGVFGWD